MMKAIGNSRVICSCVIMATSPLSGSIMMVMMVILWPIYGPMSISHNAFHIPLEPVRYIMYLSHDAMVNTLPYSTMFSVDSMTLYNNGYPKSPVHGQSNLCAAKF